jgi:predicted DNA-binding transcriptional regulator AlpA
VTDLRDLLNSASVPEQKAQAEPELVFLSKAQVLKKVPVTAPTLWAWVRAGKFPQPRALSSNKVVWIQDEVDRWMREQPVPRYKP